jgi:branched-subunit amino acid aminotransferase/4-amino-4-deoxychorismate lyase
MSAQNPPHATEYIWRGGTLIPFDDALVADDASIVTDDAILVADSTIVVADSWLVTNGTALAVGMHRARFLAGIPVERAGLRAVDAKTVDEFWDAAIALIPRTGDWFPRVELRRVADGELSFSLRLRTAPERTRSAAVATWHGDDPRTSPLVKGPDLVAMGRLRHSALAAGAQEAIILSPDGYLVEGAYSSLLWWRGSILCAPAAHLDRVDSVSARALLGVASALGTEVHFEAVTPAEINGTELWILNALHGPRIVTSWVDGPSLAELPGRLGLWRSKLEALRRPLPPTLP